MLAGHDGTDGRSADCTLQKTTTLGVLVVRPAPLVGETSPEEWDGVFFAGTVGTDPIHLQSSTALARRRLRFTPQPYLWHLADQSWSPEPPWKTLRLRG